MKWVTYEVGVGVVHSSESKNLEVIWLIQQHESLTSRKLHHGHYEFKAREGRKFKIMDEATAHRMGIKEEAHA